MFSPVDCQLCHGFQNAAADVVDPPYAPIRSWAGSMMANSARDPVFWAGVAVADADIPGETETCIRCHSPRAWLEGNETATRMQDLTTNQQNGVECMLCHRTMEDQEVVVPPGNAMYTIDETVVGTNVPRRGPWSFGAGAPQPEIPEPPHSYITDPYLGSGRFCGTCHDVTTPAERVDDEGNPMGTMFNEQRTYSEWANSAYGASGGENFRSCQDCHMPPVEDKPGCQAHVNQFTHDTGGRRHDLAGANRFMVELLKSEYGDMGENLIPDSFFDNNLDAIDALLPTSATLEVVPPESVDVTEGISSIGVRVTNETGHKLPSGYSEGRVMWIEVVAVYGEDVLFSSGAWDQDDGIEEDEQLRRYEGIAEDYADGTQFHLLRNNHWIVDNRIPPLGLAQDIETDPVGDRYTLLGDGTWPNYDDVVYTFEGVAGVEDLTPEDAEDDTLELTVRLRYLINTPEYMDFLGDNAGDAGMEVANLFDIAGGATPVTLAEETFSLPLSGLSTGAGSSSGGSSSGSDSASSSGANTTSTTDPATSSADTSTTLPPSTTDPTDAAGTAGDDTTDTDPGQDGSSDGCGCQTGNDGVPGLLWLAPLGLLLRRRRRTRRAG